MSIFDKLRGAKPPAEQPTVAPAREEDDPPGFKVAGAPARKMLPLTDLVQGTLLDASVSVSPVDTRPISQGLVTCERLWPGLPVQVFGQDPIGASLQPATDVSQICGFTVFDQSTALVSTDLDPVPTARRGMTANFVTTGSGVRLVLAAAPGVIGILCGASPTVQLSWDFVNQWVIPFSADAGLLPIRSVIAPVYIAWTITGDGCRWDPIGSAVVVQL